MSEEPVAGRPDQPIADRAHAEMEQGFIRAYLREKGYTPEALHTLPEKEAKRLMMEASLYASAKLAEIESRAQFSHELHDAWSASEFK